MSNRDDSATASASIDALPLSFPVVGIVLSGGGSDGAMGLRAIQAHGGLTLAQEPTTAIHAGMPRAAIETGVVDVVAPLTGIPVILGHHLRQQRQRREIVPTRWMVAGGNAFDELLALLQARHGADFRHYKRATLARRTERRMGLARVASLAEYLALLEERPAELAQLVKDLTIGITGFFRDPAAFVALEREVVAPLVAAGQPEQELRVWVPGCATGEEAYSLAMLFHEQMALQERSLPLTIFASDIDDEALAQARAGRYPAASAADLDARRLALHTEPGGDGFFTMKQALRESIVFARHNLISDPPFSRLDLISCRNLLIYLKAPTQDRVLGLFHFALRRGGYLLLGSAESTRRREDLFRACSKTWRLYQRAENCVARLPELLSRGGGGRAKPGTPDVGGAPTASGRTGQPLGAGGVRARHRR